MFFNNALEDFCTMRFVVLMSISLLLSGCASTSGDPEAVEGTGSPQDADEAAGPDDSAEEEAPATPTPKPYTPHAPTLAMALNQTNGTAPLPVQVTIDASDADGDVLRWEVFVDGKVIDLGKGTPTIVDIVLDAGNHTVGVTVTDGQHTVSGEQSVTVHARPTVAAAPALQVVNGTISGMSPGCAPNMPYDGLSGGFLLVPLQAGTMLQPFFASFSGQSAVDTVIFLDAADGELARFTVGVTEATGGINSTDPGVTIPDWTASGNVPDAASSIIFAACANVLGVPADAEMPEMVRYRAGLDATAEPFEML
jgi:hypothetical protein